MAVSLARAKALCNDNELSLVRASSRNEIGKHTPAQLKQRITRARTLRDKWNDQARSQRRATQSTQRSRQTDANARSAEKAELFAQALTQFESQLAKLEAKGKPAGAAPKKLAARARSATHRADRAEIRDTLKEKKLVLTQKLAILVMLLFLAVHLFVVAANAAQPPNLSNAMWLIMGAFFLAVSLWTLFLLRHFLWTT
jgi:hypothetical protein